MENSIALNLNVACILDNFSYECFKYEFNLIPLSIYEYKNQIQNEKPDFLLVESAWSGNNGQWTGKITSNHYELKELIYLCRQMNIPTVFWNKEDPDNFQYFIKAAKLFDYIFTTDSNIIEKYKKMVNHKNVYALPFSAQPKIHNPIDKDKYKLGNVSFAGSWYVYKYPDRQKDMEVILKPAFEYGLEIYDRNFKLNNSYFKFPRAYRSYIVGSLKYEDMIKAYKKYYIFLNVNSIKNSPTMFSRRVLELLACGTNVISSYSLGIEKMFPNIVKLCKTKEDTRKYIEEILNNKETRDRLSLIGQREVFSNHTCSNRVDTILGKLNLDYKVNMLLGVSIISVINKECCIDNVFKNYEAQNYKNKELIVILNNDLDAQNLKERYAGYKNIKIIQLGIEKNLGECLSFAINNCSFEYISRFDESCYYGPNFIVDLMNAFKYSDSQIVGKRTYYSYSKDTNTLDTVFSGFENQYVDFVHCLAFVAKKSILNNDNIVNELAYEPSTFFQNLINKGIKVYSADRYNYISNIKSIENFIETVTV